MFTINDFLFDNNKLCCRSWEGRAEKLGLEVVFVFFEVCKQGEVDGLWWKVSRFSRVFCLHGCCKAWIFCIYLKISTIFCPKQFEIIQHNLKSPQPNLKTSHHNLKLHHHNLKTSPIFISTPRSPLSNQITLHHQNFHRIFPLAQTQIFHHTSCLRPSGDKLNHINIYAIKTASEKNMCECNNDIK